jgi:hypothetical protein
MSLMSAFGGATGTGGERRPWSGPVGGGFSGGMRGQVEPNPGSPGGDTNPTGAGQDPFGYTNGNLLTPWNRTFQYTPRPGLEETDDQGPGPGGGPSAPPGFNFGDVSFSFRDPGAFQGLGDFAYSQGPFSGTRATAGPGFQSGVPDFRYDPYAAQRFDLRSSMGDRTRPDFQGPDALQVARYGDAARYEGVDAAALADPTTAAGRAMKFRMDQGVEALEASASARGTLRGGDTLKDLLSFGQDMASQEYEAADQRARAAFSLNEGARMGAYDRNSSAGILENQTAYGRAQDAYARGAEAFNTDAQLALSEFGVNSQERQFGADMNLRGGLAQNELAYNRRASEYDRSRADQRYVDETNYSRSASEYDRTSGNERDVYAMNAANRRENYQADAAAAAAMGNLGMQSTFGAWDRNFQNYSTGFQIEEARRQQAAAMAAAGAGAGRAAEQQDYARARDEYAMEYEQFNRNQDVQFNRLMAMTQMGFGAASQTGSFGANYAAGNNEAAFGGANARAAGYMGSGNAWANAANSFGNTVSNLGTAAMYYGSQPGTRNAPNRNTSGNPASYGAYGF